MLSTKFAVLALAATALAASGCGKSSSAATSNNSVGKSSSVASSNTSDGTLTKAELIAKADAICATINGLRSTIKLKTKQSYITLLPTLAAAEQNAVGEFRKLVPPASMASDWNQLAADTQTLSTDTARFAQYIKVQNIPATRALGLAAKNIQQHMKAVGARDGFHECGRNP